MAARVAHVLDEKLTLACNVVDRAGGQFSWRSEASSDTSR
jgi:hypothetical protein